MPDSATLELIALLVVGLVAALLVLNGFANRRAARDPVARRREHAAGARRASKGAVACLALLVVAVLLGRVLLGVLALAGLVVLGTLSVVRGRLSR
ncbi:hypothetical protein KRR39_16480 [Nocardioides panacis]|uniref:Uncharacterized protein n=1 Tax=Nocardioides panacis TaxID=2849501 RepID=A0A975SXH1_9ACTN|nr:hypothetical protein [Nocardioides panacis]QWZ07083.1 hypothetical protein KRR39_16480 [Nocardioides panacis]